MDWPQLIYRISYKLLRIGSAYGKKYRDWLKAVYRKLRTGRAD